VTVNYKGAKKIFIWEHKEKFMKYKVLELLESSREFLSGEEVSRQLGISRSAVWKHINSLKNI